MEKEIYEKIVSSIELSLQRQSTRASFSDKNYVPIPFDKKNFHAIHEGKHSEDVGFIDGSNNTIIASPGFCLSIIRTATILYKEGKRTMAKTNEFFCLVNSKDGMFETSFYPKQGFALGNIKENDETLRIGKEDVTIGKIAEVARRFAEIQAAKDAACEIVVIDGSLEPKITNEDTAMLELHKTGKTICGLSKTSEMRTDSGDSLISAIMQISPTGSWYYHPLFLRANEREKQEVMIVKLNGKSNYCFRFEINKLEEGEFVLSQLSEISKDPLFLGYPYGLVEAHQFSKITNREAEQYRTIFALRAGERYKKIEDYMKAVDAHQKLDLM